ncbi:unnamed protein product [Caenorhabditis brenneri]
MSETVDEIRTCNDNVDQKTRSFVLKHVFGNVSIINENNNSFSEMEEHFGVTWYMGIWHIKEHLAVYLCVFPRSRCRSSGYHKGWSIDTEFKIDVLHPNGNPAHTASVVEIRVKITKMTGIGLFLRRFDDEESSDVALVADGKKFHVSKQYLASQSSYFESMFLGRFNESGKSEIELMDIDGYELQKYLEMLYGEDALDNASVAGILRLADMYDTKTLIEKCEKYLLTAVGKSLKQKFELAVTYNLVELKKKCMSEITTVNDVLLVNPERVRDMDHYTLAELLEKTFSFAQ